MSNWRIIFMGTPDFATASLRALVENKYNVVGVITVPDKPAGRGQKLRKSSVKEYAISKKIPVLQPSNLQDPYFLSNLQKHKSLLVLVLKELYCS